MKQTPGLVHDCASQF